MNVWGFLAVVVVLIGIFLVSNHFNGRHFSEPKEFTFEGETFIWTMDPHEARPFGRKLYECGTFQYADGTPVTDHRLHRMLQDHWVETNRRAESVNDMA
jgi:hypothetical protein